MMTGKNNFDQRGDGIDVAIELLDAAALELSVEESEEAGVLRELHGGGRDSRDRRQVQGDHRVVA